MEEALVLEAYFSPSSFAAILARPPARTAFVLRLSSMLRKMLPAGVAPLPSLSSRRRLNQSFSDFSMKSSMHDSYVFLELRCVSLRMNTF